MSARNERAIALRSSFSVTGGEALLLDIALSAILSVMVSGRSMHAPASGQATKVEPDGRRRVPSELTAIIEREGAGYVALCPEVDVASQGDTIQEARTNLREALELFFEAASDSEIARRLRSEVYVTRVQVSVHKPEETATSPR